MLYNKKPNLKDLHEWGTTIWMHDTSGTKLDGQSKVGRWIGYDEVSNGHRVYWLDKRSVTIECSVKFSNDNMVIPSIPITKPIQGRATHQTKI